MPQSLLRLNPQPRGTMRAGFEGPSERQAITKRSKQAREPHLKIGLLAFVIDSTANPAAVARKAEALGFESVAGGAPPQVGGLHHRYQRLAA